MKKPLFSGVCTALVTPFRDDAVNYPMLELLLRRQIDAGIPAVVICGTTGESATVRDDEKIEMFRRAKSYVGDDLLIIAGTGSNSTSHTAMLSVRAEEVGVDGLLIVSPYYNKTTQEGILAHYWTVARTVSLPIIAYNVPGRTGMDITPQTCRQLSAASNIVGIKEASEDITKVIRIRNLCENLAVYSGNDGMIVPSMSLGALGVVSVISNVVPEETIQLTDLCRAGNYSAAAELQGQLLPLIDGMFSVPNPIPVKEAMKIIGFDCGSCRLPLWSISDENRRKLEKLLR